VFREGETVPLGTTPFDAAFVPSAHPVRIRVELTGYEPAAAELALDTSHEVTMALERTPEAVAPVRPRKVDKRTKPTAPAVKPLQREGTIDPFAPTN